MDQLQFYPTPPALAKRCWAKFKNQTNITKLLEPSAGRGDLVPESLKRSSNYNTKVDACEIDVTHHPALREQGINVIGLDFFEVTSEMAAGYSHILLNPPFREGASHLLHAWNIMRGGEIVAILNAETVRNAHTAERALLVRLIEEHGDVEYLSEAFTSLSGAQRTTDVEVAVVHLVKPAPSVDSIVGDLIGKFSARGDRLNTKEHVLDEDGRVTGQIAIQGVTKGEIEALIMVVRMASEAAADATRAEFRKRHCFQMMGLSPDVMVALGLYESLIEACEDSEKAEDARRKMAARGRAFQGDLAQAISEATMAVNKAGWTALFSRQEVTKRLSTETAKAMQAQMDLFAEMAFTEKNVDLFISGLIASQADIQNAMMSDVFFALFKHNSANMAVHRAWKSNDVHRLGMRLRMKRLIIPGINSYGSISHDALSFLSDVDKVFCLLDCKTWSNYGEGSLQQVVGDISRRDQRSPKYTNGSMLHSTYFKVRYYAGTGTLHLTPVNLELIERFNRLVGRLHNWIPPMDGMASEDFWKAYRSESYGEEALKRAGLRDWDLYQIMNPMRNLDRDAMFRENQLERSLISVCAEDGVDIAGSLSSEHAHAPSVPVAMIEHAKSSDAAAAGSVPSTAPTPDCQLEAETADLFMAA